MHLDERVSANPGLSPGVVQDDEHLLRELFHPQHVQNGMLLERAIPVTDLRENGFSLHRMRHVTQQFVQEVVEERLSRPRKVPWRDEGVAVLRAGTVRALRVSGNQGQAFVIIDTAMESNRGHASLFAAHPCEGPAHARKLRALLLPLLQERMSVEEAYA